MKQVRKRLQLQTSVSEDTFVKWLGTAPRLAYELALTIKSTHWFIQGTQFLRYHEYLDELFEAAVRDADYFGELSAELDTNIVNLYGPTSPEQYNQVFDSVTGPLPISEGLSRLRQYLESYISELTSAYNTIECPNIRSEFDGIIRYWSKVTNYFLKYSL